MSSQHSLSVGLYDAHFSACIGLLPQEKIIPQSYVASVEVSYVPASLLTHPDQIDATISYVDIFDITADAFSEGANLLETVAISIANKLKDTFPSIQSGYVQIFKLNPPIPKCTGKTGIKYFF